jgi:hypothetical protein
MNQGTNINNDLAIFVGGNLYKESSKYESDYS